MNNIDKQYQSLLQDILDNGVEKKDRTGTGTISVFGRQIRHKMSEGFPLLTTKKMPWKSIVTELLWFLQGNTNIKWLVDNGCNIWNGDAYKNYVSKVEKYASTLNVPDDISEFQEVMDLVGDQMKSSVLTQEEFINKIKTDDEFANKWGELGPIYGKQWRSWGRKNVVNYNLENVKSSDKVKVMDLIRDGGDYSKYDVKVTYQNNSTDQIQTLIDDLKTNPDSRRLMVSAWNVGDLDQMVLPPCHYGFQVYTRELSLEERATIWNNTHNPAGNIYTHNQYNENEIPARAISLMWNQRSVDTFLGLPFNIASYGLLLEMLAKEVNMVPEELIGNLGDVHLYSNHIEQAKEQIGRDLTDEERYNIWFNNNYETGMERYFNPNDLPDFDNNYYTSTPKRTREPYELPRIELTGSWKFSSSSPCFGDTIQHKDINLVDYKSHSEIKAPLSN